MIFSKTCSYGIRAVLYMATQEGQQFLPIKEISDHLNIPFHFLTKILQILTQNKILISYKGPKGGVAFARSPKTINVLEIITAIDGSKFFEQCILGLDECDYSHPCALHNEWIYLSQKMRFFLEKITIAEMAEEAKRNGFRLAVAGDDRAKSNYNSL